MIREWNTKEGTVTVTRQPDGGITWVWDPEDADMSLVSRVALEQLLAEANEYGKFNHLWRKNK